MKITNKQTTVTVKKDFKTGALEIKAGRKFNARDVNVNGLVIWMGHGWNEVVPHEYLGEYEITYNIVKTDGNTTTKEKIREDVTEVYNEHWKNTRAKIEKDKKHAAKVNLKNRIATLRKTIKFVNTGKAEKELKMLLEELTQF